MLSWITDSNFDIDYHVRHSALPRPGRIRGLLALMPRLHVQRLDPRALVLGVEYPLAAQAPLGLSGPCRDVETPA